MPFKEGSVVGNELRSKAEIREGQDPNFLNTVRYIWNKYNPIIIFIVLVIAASLASPQFLKQQNVLNVLRQVSTLGIMSMGMLMVIVMGGIDLSVGSLLALGCVLTGLLINGTKSVFIAVVVVLFVGLLLGAISGLFISLKNMAPFVMTLAMMTIARGFAYIYSRGNPINIKIKSFGEFIQGYFLLIPNPVWIMLIIFAITVFIFRKTFMGRIFLAIGSNEEAVRLSGIKVKFYKFIGYTLSGMLAAGCGVIVAGRTSVGSPLVGVGNELDVIAAIVIGGASLNGGKGSPLYSLIGAIILGIISNIMNLMNIPAYPQEVVKGIIIIFAVLFSNQNNK